ncbi:LamG-like jellyroll fold domain-containing protein [Croceimicrobium hydrocarbonivorans]|uniref:T9SS type A sorting domain-containing protein n=1 Tax=Croceimicrobium hydrocarbonivorans TaxID=2761580 RepID=A0A7H0VIA8_9FLAO|nr:LamG-like jellyroll fold domain-containing protein [Croceimicrobium hydrocarbonivorans]QNR25456.1 T9SS type A sorting domain-containing protein [Croceimicrobium hydrocarbonivorans]
MKNPLFNLKFKGLSFLLLLSWAGQSQNALDFDGIDDQVTVASASGQISGGTGMTLSMWVNPTTVSTGWPDFDGYAGFRNETNADFYILQLGGTDVEARFRNSGGTVYTITANSALNLNSWNHFVLTYDGSTLSLYQDGTFVSSIPATGSFSSSSETFNLGFLPFSGNNFMFDGQLDDVGLWNRALSSTEVNTLYNACGMDLTDPSLKLSYEFNQGTAGGSNSGISSLTDSKGNINGTLSNFTLSGNSSNFVTSPLQGINNIVLNINSCGPYLGPNGINYTQSGHYIDTISPSTSGCDTIMDLTLVVNNLDSSASRIASNTLEANETDTAATYQWLKCTDNYSKIVGATRRQFTFVLNGSYAVEVSLNGCVDTSACIVITNVGLEELNADMLHIYPNPAQNHINLEYPAGSFDKYELLSLDGALIKQGKLNRSGNSVIELAQIPGGLFFIRTIGSAGTLTQKIQITP